MPSVSSSNSESSVQSRESSFGSGEMDSLMRRITDSLRLRANCKQKVQAHAQRGSQRPTPYPLPTAKKCLNCQTQEPCKYHRQKRVCEKSHSGDPHSLLQELLRDKSLIAEAVKRLQYKLETFSEKMPPTCSVESDYDYVCDDGDTLYS